MLYQLTAGILTAVFIATVYYLLVLFSFPSVSLSSGYLLGLIVLFFGLYRMIVARKKGKKNGCESDHHCRSSFIDSDIFTKFF